MKAKLLAFFTWNYHTGAWLALPILFLLELALAQALVFTLTCNTAGMACQYAISGDKLVASYAGVMMSLSESEEYTLPAKKQLAKR